MTQLTFAEAEYAHKKHQTRRELFPGKMDRLIPWAKLEKKLARHYPKGENGRPPYPLATMLRVHAMRLFYNLSDPALEDALYEIESMRQFAGLRLSERLPDETTILNFRHFLEQHPLGEKIFDTINQHLSEQGLLLREGSIVDATILSAPSSTKNQTGEQAQGQSSGYKSSLVGVKAQHKLRVKSSLVALYDDGNSSKLRVKSSLVALYDDGKN